MLENNNTVLLFGGFLPSKVSNMIFCTSSPRPPCCNTQHHISSCNFFCIIIVIMIDDIYTCTALFGEVKAIYYVEPLLHWGAAQRRCTPRSCISASTRLNDNFSLCPFLHCAPYNVPPRWLRPCPRTGLASILSLLSIPLYTHGPLNLLPYSLRADQTHADAKICQSINQFLST